MKNPMIGLFLAFLFTFLQAFFQLKFYSVVFVSLLILMIGNVFLAEKFRLFIWVLGAFFLGEMIYMYTDRFLLALPFSEKINLVMARFFLLIPIGLVTYVIYKFKKTIIPFKDRTKWGNIQKRFIFGLLIILSVFLPSLAIRDISITAWLIILLYSLINGTLLELLWRGILLNQLRNLVSEKMAILFVSIAYGLSYLSFGYSTLVIINYSILGVFLGVLTIQSKSLVPAIILQIVITLCSIITGQIPVLIV
ncbi:type II CAAX endopeptidase family protein [Bacillus sp. 31A1R]|uniref:Type II CAAX endopeptidase family protein n=1 Tax=Robertmurraya mangrovi TaxID=3098077 RepID=A0ABU5IZZ3_9BACI|nr:type II CAAX endopeptidase family protein [Bacillus sp. 31A1R]MDZ5472739.1 type II CAAX endopeptidase family protein [Bacillus sp. 31A1R]